MVAIHGHAPAAGRDFLIRQRRVFSPPIGGEPGSPPAFASGGLFPPAHAATAGIAPTYAGLPVIMNGASDLMVAVLGDRGRHARSTIGVAELPADAAVEVEAMFEFA